MGELLPSQRQMDRHGLVWVVRGKAVLIRNRYESRFRKESSVSAADLALVVRTVNNDTAFYRE